MSTFLSFIPTHHSTEDADALLNRLPGDVSLSDLQGLRERGRIKNMKV